VRSIPFFPYSKLFASHEREFLEALKDVCRRGAYILQEDCKEFERQLAAFIGVSHAFGVGNGTDAIIIGLKAAGIGPGDEVILPSHTYVATAAAVHLVGATPVLAECGPDHLLDAEDAARRITPRTRAIMAVQLNGRTCDMDRLGQVAVRHSLMICEDAAQGLGSKFDGQCAGGFGVFGTISFYPAKLLGCFGDGGAVVTNDDEIARRVALLRDHGRNEKGRVVAWGYNSRLDNVQAAILNQKLKTFEQDIERRRAIATLYHNGLRDVPELVLPPGPNADPRHFDVYQNYEIEAERRDELKLYLETEGVRTMIQWGGTPVHQLKELGFDVDLPRTDALFRRCVMLPMNVALSDDDVHYIIGAVRSFYGR
jgi:dTDP-4-amino-4,6-dideoxygalactose transaminase